MGAARPMAASARAQRPQKDDSASQRPRSRDGSAGASSVFSPAPMTANDSLSRRSIDDPAHYDQRVWSVFGGKAQVIKGYVQDHDRVLAGGLQSKG